MDIVSLHKHFEPSIMDVLSDPIIQILMEYDGITEDEMERFLVRSNARFSPQSVE